MKGNVNCVVVLFLLFAGMNAAVRATVRVGLYTGAKVFFVHEVSDKQTHVIISGL